MGAIIFVLALPALLAQTPPTIGPADQVLLSWDAVTTDAAGAPLASPITGYEIAVTEVTADMNGTATVSSVKTRVAATANVGADITPTLKLWGKTGKARLWVRATDGYAWSAWSAPLEVLLIFVAPAPPTNLQIRKG